MKNIMNPLKYVSGFLMAALMLAFTAADASAQTTHTFTNTNAIEVRDLAVANPYPSSITVGSVPQNATRIIVKLKNFSHSYPEDVGVLLVAPNGQKVRVFTDCLGDGGGDGIQNVDYTFDDFAATALPDNPTNDTPSGTYKPKTGTSDGVSPEHPADFPAPAPAGPYAATLASLNNTNASGVWKIFVDDDGKGDAGTVAGGWELSFQTTSPSSSPAVISGTVNVFGGGFFATARVTMIDQNGLTTTVFTNFNGYYQFPSMPTDANYTLSVSAKGRTFTPSSQLIYLIQDSTVNWFGQ